MKSRTIIPLAVLFLFLITIPAHAQNYTAKEYKSQIRSALEVEDYAKAVEVCDEAIEHYPDNADFWYYKGFALAELKRFDEAMEAYEMGISIHFDEHEGKEFENEEASKHYHNGLANKKKNPDLAIEEHLIAHELGPTNPLPFYEMAVIYFIKKDFERAIVYFKKSLKIKPSNTSGIIGLGRSYLENTQCEDALFYFKLGKMMRPNDNRILEYIDECLGHMDD